MSCSFHYILVRTGIHLIKHEAREAPCTASFSADQLGSSHLKPRTGDAATWIQRLRRQLVDYSPIYLLTCKNQLESGTLLFDSHLRDHFKEQGHYFHL